MSWYFRRFEKEDWQVWKDAKKFKDGSNPYLYVSHYESNDKYAEIQIMADRNGLWVALVPWDYKENDIVWHKRRHFTNKRAMKKFNEFIHYYQTIIWYSPDTIRKLLDGECGEFISVRMGFKREVIE